MSRDNLIRRLKLRNYFGNSNEESLTLNSDFRKKFVEKSNFVPPAHKLDPKILELTEEIQSKTDNIIKKYKNATARQTTETYGGANANSQQIADYTKTSDCNLIKLQDKNNISREDHIIINELVKNKQIIIKSADKGGATVVMDRENYLKEAYRQLNNNKYYLKLPTPIYHENVRKIKTILQDMLNEKFISNDQFNYLTGPKDYKARSFYLLPKIHKKHEKWPWPNMPEGRPIVSDVDSETYRISSYIDYFINKLAIGHPSYVKNSYEFVNKVKEFKMENDWLLVTGDVSALYTNMHFDRTLDCVRKAFSDNPDPSRPDNSILKLLEISLKNNDFNFNGEYFLQILGTAMGKRFAPGLANLYLIELDYKAMNGFQTKPLLFIRYLDDIFFIWPGSVASLKEFEIYLNSLITDIKITFEWSRDSISFLDVLIYKNNGHLKTKTFFKETDTHQLLQTDSFHPKHTFNGLVKSQLIRFKRLSSCKEDYDNTCKILFSYLKVRGYNQSKLRKQQHNIWHNYNEKQQEAQTTMDKNPTRLEVIPIIVDYCSVGTELAKTYKTILAQNDIPCLENTKYITAYKNSRNLKQILVKSRLETNKPGAFIGCSSARCQACRLHAPPSKTYKINNTGQTFNISGNITCETKTIIYLITCRACNKQYIGETGRGLRDRLNNHKSDIKNQRRTPVAVHFNQPKHSILDLKITPIEIIENHANRLSREAELQRKYKTAYPMGINNTPVN